MKTERTATDKQRESNGSKPSPRDQQGRFVKGHTNGFQAGQSGNPAGRPKSITLSEAYRKQLAQPMPNDPEGRTFAEVIAFKQCSAAAEGDTTAAREIADRVGGKPRQAVDLDVTAHDWRELARQQGLKEEDVIREAHQLITESADEGGSSAGA